MGIYADEHTYFKTYTNFLNRPFSTIIKSLIIFTRDIFNEYKLKSMLKPKRRSYDLRY